MREERWVITLRKRMEEEPGLQLEITFKLWSDMFLTNSSGLNKTVSLCGVTSIFTEMTETPFTKELFSNHA